MPPSLAASVPLTATLTEHFPDDGRLVIMNAASPVSARRARLFAPTTRNFDREGIGASNFSGAVVD
jgi:hypothetical protein